MDFSATEYRVIRDEIFRDTTVDLDGNAFVDCSIIGCEIVFRGEAPFAWWQTQLDNNRLRIEGRARMVMSMLARMLPENADLIAIAEQLRTERLRTERLPDTAQ